jgi:restriction endonuclease S subunit
LEGLEITIYNKSKILVDNDEFRIDAEYYQKQYLKLYKQIEGSPMLVNLTYMSDLSSNGSFAAVKAIKDDNNPKVVPFIRSGNVGDTFIKESDLEFISKEAHSNLPKSTTELHEIMMARKGKIGGASIIMEDEVNFNCSENVIKLRVLEKDKLNPFYFTSYFNSKYGLKQVERLATGNVQPWVSIFQIRKLMIPILDINFQNEIERLITLAHKKNINSGETYNYGEKQLLNAIGLQDFEEVSKAVNIKSFSESFVATGRLDAEYYQPKYDIIDKAIRNYSNGFATLNDFTENYSTGYPYKSDSYITDGGVPLIRINNINKGYLDISNATQIPLSDTDLSPKDVANENDLLISMSGTIGNSCRIPKGIKAVINQRIMRITPKNFNNEVLPMIINSPIGEYQLNRIGTGGVQTNISSTDIKQILIPKIKEDVQEQVASMIKQSFLLKNESEHLLEVAKKAVEIAIEENENVALKYIKQETNE